MELNFLTPAFAAAYARRGGALRARYADRVEPGASPDEFGGHVQAAYPVEVDSWFGADTLRSQAGPTLDGMATGLRIVALVLALVGGTAIALSLVRDTSDRLGEQGSLRAFGFERRGLLVHLGLASAAAALIGVVLGGTLSTCSPPGSSGGWLVEPRCAPSSGSTGRCWSSAWWWLPPSCSSSWRSWRP